MYWDFLKCCCFSYKYGIIESLVVVKNAANETLVSYSLRANVDFGNLKTHK